MMTTKPIKSLGQNFLTNNDVAKLIVSEAGIDEGDVVVEIGGGEGAITQEIIESLPNNAKLYVFEIDQRLIKLLRSKMANNPNVTIIDANFLDYDLASVSAAKIIGAIPYYITSPIIHKILELNERPEKVVLLIQEEVADKIANTKKGTSYWSNVILGYDAEKSLMVGPENFNPAPKVNSAVITLSRNKSDEEIVKRIGFHKWSKFLHRAYKHPRKMLNKVFDPELLQKVEIEPTSRPHNVDGHKWIQLYNYI